MSNFNNSFAFPFSEVSIRSQLFKSRGNDEQRFAATRRQGFLELNFLGNEL